MSSEPPRRPSSRPKVSPQREKDVKRSARLVGDQIGRGSASTSASAQPVQQTLPSNAPLVSSSPMLAPQVLYQAWAGERDPHGSRLAASRTPDHSPERDPRKALLILQHADASVELHKAEKELRDLNALKEGLDVSTVSKHFQEVWKTIKHWRETVQEIEKELGGGPHPSGSGRNAPNRSDSGCGTARPNTGSGGAGPGSSIAQGSPSRHFNNRADRRAAARESRK